MDGEGTKMDTPQRTAWHRLSAAAVLGELGSSAETGLTVVEAQHRREKFGPNELPAAPARSIWRMLLDQFKEVLVLILIVAAVISASLGEAGDTIVILLVVLLNAVLGVVQEAKAERSLNALMKLTQPTTTIIRDGRISAIASSELTPGDVVLLEAGSYVPADLRLLEAVNLRVDESALTGESVPVEKHVEPINATETALGDRLNMAFSGTHIAYGRAKGVVVGIGISTELGRIAELLSHREAEVTPLQRRLIGLGKILAASAVALVGLVFLAGILRGEEMLEMFMTAVSLAVAVVPEGLPAVVTIVLALGVQRMSKRRAIIRRLPAVETLGSATVICSDKTGTLTQNQMTVVRAYLAGQEYEISGSGYDPAGGTIKPAGDETADPPAILPLIAGMALASDASLARENGGLKPIGDPTEVALVVLAEKGGRSKEELTRLLPRVDEIPFDSVRKRMTTLHDLTGAAELPLPGGGRGFLAFTKGGFDVLLPLCQNRLAADGSIDRLDEAERNRLRELNERLAGQALRVLALACRHYPAQPAQEELERDLTFIGLVGMIDPPRPEAIAAVKEAQAAGIRTIMITGDHQATATAIAEQIGIRQPGDLVVSGHEIEAMSDEDLAEVAAAATVFARVAPEHKLRIVDALKSRGHVVAMTGDGVNDAPALKRADIGAAMGITGTDVAKEASDMVIADDNYATVVEAVREGRTIYANILKAIQYLLSCNSGELIAIFIAILAGLGRPLTAIQILWTNLVTDSLPALSLGMEPPEPGVMSQPPRPAREGIFAHGLGLSILLQGALIGGLTLAGYLLTLRTTGDQATAGTVAFITLSLSQLVHAFNTRAARVSLFKIGLHTNRPLLLAFFVSTALLLGVTLIPPLMTTFDAAYLTIGQWGLVVGLSLMPLVLVEMKKFILARLRRPGV